ncbi:hypothetical protein BYT27DRAFT_7335102 [Phlegmacium glaucopus]|nr:hypothetical protein BYT27DRAFT_7335102 [Phlegmacium glaucopus]
MAAMVERPISALNDMQTPGPSIEIIDVDAFEDEGLNLISDLEEPSLTTFNPRPVARPLDRGSRRATPQTIYLLDSDDDDLIVASGSGVNSNPGQPSTSRRILSPPPRNVSVTMIPPVPPVPARFAGQTSFPMRLQPPPFPAPPVIRPTSRPFPFENALDAPIAGPSNHRRQHRHDAPAPQAAPSSHHVPSMGLGGAIISSHRLGNTSESQFSAGLPSGAATTRMRMPSFTSRLVDLARYSNFAFRQAPVSSVIMGENAEFDDIFGDDVSGEGLFGSWRDINYRRRQTGTQEKDQYLSSYTHPSQPDPGFTFDFALPTSSTADIYNQTRLFPPTSINNPIVLDDDDDNGNGTFTAIAGPSTSTSDTGQVTATLVCANCSDSLLINAALHPNENDRRVWGLRCGHIIDEKCLNQLGQPPGALDDSPVSRKGKAKATDSGPSYGDTIVSENPTVLEAIQENSIRSRLRSRPGSTSTTTSSLPPISRLLDSTHHLPPWKRRRVSSKKKKVEGEFLWRCPVVNCGREHVSIKVDGVWGPEKERESVGKSMGVGQLEARGAIPIFA